MKLRLLFQRNNLAKLRKSFSNAPLVEDKAILKEFPRVISTIRLDQILEESSHKYSSAVVKPDAIDNQYPNQVDSDKLEIALKEAEETKKRFSVY